VSEPRSIRWLLRRAREAARDNQWLVPLIGAVVGWILAMLVGTGGREEANPWTISVDRARDTLAGSLALVFTSMSIVLALAAVAAQNVVGRFGSRVMRLYARRSPDRWVIAGFTLAATFIATEQFQMRRLVPDSPAPVASLVISALLLGLAGVLVIVYISAIVRWFRVDRAVAGVVAVARESSRAATRQRRGRSPASIPERPDHAVDIPAPRQGHLAEVDADVLYRECQRVDAVAVITEPIGAPVVIGQPIGWVAARDPDSELNPDRAIRDAVDVSGTREIGESIEYGIFGLVDIAIMALSPAVNDPNSALEVIEEISFLFQDLADVPLGPYAVPDGESWPRVVVNVRTYGELVDLATTQIVFYGLTDPMVVRSLRRFAASLQLLDLDEADRAHVDAFAAKLDGAPSR
jgi:uncharacterized membrane protein